MLCVPHLQSSFSRYKFLVFLCPGTQEPVVNDLFLWFSAAPVLKGVSLSSRKNSHPPRPFLEVLDSLLFFLYTWIPKLKLFDLEDGTKLQKNYRKYACNVATFACPVLILLYMNSNAPIFSDSFRDETLPSAHPPGQ